MAKKFDSDEARKEYNRKTMARWRAANPEKVEAAKPSAAERTALWRAGLTAEELATYGEQTKHWRDEFKARDPEGYRVYVREACKKHRYSVRKRLIEALGGKCVCCGITENEFLALDHKDGGGNAHRRELGLAGSRFYNWVWDMGNIRPGFQLLCHNCNSAKGYYGYCPHERERPVTS